MQNSNTRLVLALVAVVGAAVVAGWFVMRGDPVDGDVPPAERPEDDPVARPSMPAREAGSLSGEVRIFRTGEPAAGVAVRVETGDDPVEASTREDGGFTVRVPSDVDLTLTATAPSGMGTAEFAPVVLTGLRVEPGNALSLGTLYLERGFLVKGVVVAGNGGPVAGARVAAYRPDLEEAGFDLMKMIQQLGRRRVPLDEAETGADGRFVLRKLSPGTWRLEATAEGFALGSIAEAIVSPKTEDHEFRISLSPGLGLSGVVKRTGGEPIPDAVITALRTGDIPREGFDFHPIQAIADEDGRFRFDNLMPGQVQLMASAEGYPRTVAQQVDAGQSESVEIVIGGRGSIRGTVRGPDREPVEGAEVLVAVGGRGGAFQTTLTDADGKYRIENLPADRIQFLRVQAAGFPAWPDFSGGMGGHPEFGTLEEGKTVVKDVELVNGATLSGTVRNGLDSRPIAGARISIFSPGSMMELGGNVGTISDEEGRYRIEGLQEGTHLVLARADGYYQKGLEQNALQQAFMAMRGPAGGSRETDPDLPLVKVEAGVSRLTKDLVALPGATVRGTVLAPDGDPVAGARVTTGGGGRDEMSIIAMIFRIGPRAALTGKDGTFELTGVGASDELRLTARAEGWVDGVSDPIRVQAGGEVEGLVVRLRTGGKVTGTIVGPDGALPKGALVRVMADPKGDLGSNFQWQIRRAEPVTVAEDGTFTVAGLEPGTVLVAAEAPDLLPAVRRGVQVPEGGTAGGISLTLLRGLEIAGTVVDDGGDPLDEIHIWMSPASGESNDTTFRRSESVRTKSDGSFSVKGLAPGPYHVNLNAPGYANESRPEVIAGTTDLRIVLSRGLPISGTITLPDGRPGAGLSVNAWTQDGSSGFARSDERGEFTIENLKPGSYRISVHPSGGSEPAVAFAVAEVGDVAAGTTGLSIRLETGKTISGTVVDEEGRPVAGARVWARLNQEAQGGLAQPGRFVSGTADENGAFVLSGVGNGEWKVSANAPGYGVAEEVDAAPDAVGVKVVLKRQ